MKKTAKVSIGTKIAASGSGASEGMNRFSSSTNEEVVKTSGKK